MFNIIGVFIAFFLTHSAVFAVVEIKDEVKYYKGHQHSLIPWKDLDESKFLSWREWQDEWKKREKNPHYREEVRDTQIHERVGLVLGCHGECRLFRSMKHARVRYLSTVREGDEVETGENSYLWIFLMDGTLVRLAPESSMSFSEFNIAPNENFFFARMNFGNILWWNRTEHTFKVQNVKETDTLFLPLRLLEANYQEERAVITRDLFLARSRKSVGSFERLNKLIKDNNALVNKRTKSFLVFPNGTLEGDNFIAEFIILRRGKSYFKLRGQRQLGFEQDYSPSSVVFHGRGYQNKETQKLVAGAWYRVEENGESFEQLSDDQKFSMGEFPTKYIPSILSAREFLFKEYSSFIFSDIGRKAMSERHGHRLWNYGTDKDELKKRLSFLRSYTRRVETTNLKVVEVYKRSLKEKNEKLEVSVYGPHYYQKAMQSYYNFKEELPYIPTKEVLLNSQKKKFWRVIHGKY